MTTKLVEALRKRFPDGRTALRFMGLDETLLDDDTANLLRKNPQKFIDLCIKRYGSQGTLSRLGMDAAMFDPTMKAEERTAEYRGHFDPRGPGGEGEVEGGVHRSGEDRHRRRADDDLPEKVETMPPENLGGEDEFSPEEEQSLREYAADMHRQGKDGRVIDDAMSMARDFLRRHRHHADDMRHRHHADDVLPSRVDVQDARDRVPLRGGKLNRPRFSHDNFGTEDPANPDGRFLIDHGLDAMDSSRREIAQIRRLVQRFGPEAGARPERFRGATDGKPLTELQTAELHKLIPGLALIGDVFSGDGPGLAGHKNPYEI